MEYGSECWQKAATVTYVERRRSCAESILDRSRRGALEVDGATNSSNANSWMEVLPECWTRTQP